jgi:hypothetical protein
MNELQYTLVSDGPSDSMLLPVLDWLLVRLSKHAFKGHWAELRTLRQPPKELRDRVQAALEIFPCDLLFVHRDAERDPYASRVAEIELLLGRCRLPSWVAVVPVRMQEAWFLFDEHALREAAGNPNGRMSLALPQLNRTESEPDPKRLLEMLLRNATGLHGRRLEKLRLAPMRRRVAGVIGDFSPLLALPAFAALERDIRNVLTTRQWL